MTKSWRYFLLALLAVLQVAAVLFVFEQLELELQTGVKEALPFILFFFALSTVVPDRFRIWTYNLLFVTVLSFAFGALISALCILAIVAVVWWLRSKLSSTVKLIGILLFLSGLLLLRLNAVYAPRLNILATYLGVILMFRIFSFWYYRKFEPMLPSSWDKDLAYFLIFPNLFFLLFPIIDYKKHSHSTGKVPIASSWQKGIRWMLRGVVHLFLYRVCYHFFSLSPAEVTDLASLLQYGIGTYLLILRITGIFHFSLGLICLFGFDLPEIFDNLFLAESIPDIWRRVNMYWREFIQKLFFHPVYMNIRKRAGRYAILIASLMIFVISYLLHNYQWLWIRGGVQLKINDLLFWLTLGTIISVTVFIKQQHHSYSVVPPKASWQQLWNRAWRITGCLLFMSLLWSLWTSESFSEWIYLLSFAKETDGMQLLMLGLSIAGLVVSLMVLLKMQERYKILNDPPDPVWQNISLITLLLLLTVAGQLPVLKGNTDFSKLMHQDKNDFDKELHERGYYKTLIEGDRSNVQSLWEVRLRTPLARHEIHELIEPTADLYARKLIPGKSFTQHGLTVNINAAGMRDKEYDTLRTPHALRIALLGGSYEMGSGVSDGENFESLTEESVNRNDSMQVELLNFSVGAYTLIQYMKQAQEITPAFSPDYVIVFGHHSDPQRILHQFADYIQNGTDLQYPELIGIKKAAAVRQSMSEVEIRRRLAPYMTQLMAWGYRTLAASIRKQHAIPVWVYMPVFNEKGIVTENESLHRLALQNGFDCFSMAERFKGLTPQAIQSYRISAENTHPNARAHRLLAKEFERIITVLRSKYREK